MTESPKAYFWIAEKSEPGMSDLTGASVRYELTSSSTPPSEIQPTYHAETGIPYADSFFEAWELHSVHNGTVVSIYDGHDTALQRPNGAIWTKYDLSHTKRRRT